MTRNDWAIISVLHEFKQVVAVGGFRTTDEGHVDAWPRLGWHLDFDYGAFARGRVNWREEGDQFLLLLDPILLRRGWVPRLLEHFALHPDRTIVMTDPHYRSRRHPPAGA